MNDVNKILIMKKVTQKCSFDSFKEFLLERA